MKTTAKMRTAPARDEVHSVRMNRRAVKQMRQAAAKMGITLGAFVAQAAAEKAAEVAKICPTCGRPHRD